MTLGETVLFPQAMMPLYIFEPRYRAMLDEVLANDRIFAVAALDPSQQESDQDEPLHRIAGLGVVRACRKNPDGTSNLILQGISRIECDAIVTEAPFRRIRIKPVQSERDGPEEDLQAIRTSLLSLVQTQIRLGAGIPEEVVQFLSKIEEPENLLDLSIFTLCSSGSLKQHLLETRGILERFRKFEHFLKAQIEQLELDRKLKGDLGDEDPGQN